MNLLPMSYFIEVVNQQGISRAAEKLQITQQTLSSHIAALEKELGCSLFIRKPKFRLTAEGMMRLKLLWRTIKILYTIKSYRPVTFCVCTAAELPLRKE